MNRKNPEHYLQASFVTWASLNLKSYPELKLMYAIPNAGKRSPRQGAWMKAEGLKSGVWDIFLPVPSEFNERTYCGLYIETKIHPNKLTPNQKQFREDLEHEYCFNVCYSLDDFISAITIYLAGEKF